MRTTLSIDDDVLLAAQERARRERRSVGAVLSQLARAGLAGGDRQAAAAEEVPGFVPLPHRGGIVTNALIDDLLETE
jgi:hypothetical protein